MMPNKSIKHKSIVDLVSKIQIWIDPDLLSAFYAVYPEISSPKYRQENNPSAMPYSRLESAYKPSSGYWIYRREFPGAMNNFMVWDGLDPQELEKALGLPGRNLSQMYILQQNYIHRILEHDKDVANLNNALRVLKQENYNFHSATNEKSRLAEDLNAIQQSTSYQVQKYGVVPDIYEYSYGAQLDVRGGLRSFFSTLNSPDKGYLGMFAERDVLDLGKDSPKAEREEGDPWVIDLLGEYYLSLRTQKERQTGEKDEKSFPESFVSSIFTQDLSPGEVEMELEKRSVMMPLAIGKKKPPRFFPVVTLFSSPNPLEALNLKWETFMSNMVKFLADREEDEVYLYGGDLSDKVSRVLYYSFSNIMDTVIVTGIQAETVINFQNFYAHRFDSPVEVDGTVKPRTSGDEDLFYSILNDRGNLTPSSRKRYNDLVNMLNDDEVGDIQSYGFPEFGQE